MGPLSLGLAGGGILASLFGGKSSRWSGTKAKLKKFETLDKYQKQNLKDINKYPDVQLQKSQYNPSYQAGNKYIQDILSQNPEMMQQFEAPYMRQFKEQIIPQLAERFAGNGSASSSAFNQTMAQAGTSLSERLASLRANLGMTAAGQALSYAQAPYQEQMGNEELNLKRRTLGLGTPAFGMANMPGSEGAGTNLMGNIASAGMNLASQGMLNRAVSAPPSNMSSAGNWAFSPTPSPFGLQNQAQQYRLPGQM